MKLAPFPAREGGWRLGLTVPRSAENRYRFLARGTALVSIVSYGEVTGYKVMFGLGWPEVGIIGIAALLIFGPKKIPEVGRALGKTLRGFKDEMNKPTSDEDNIEQDSP